MKTTKLKAIKYPLRRGMATLDYVMVTAISVPLTGTLVFLLLRAMRTLYQFATATVGWTFP
jgi:hypothetical protein